MTAPAMMGASSYSSAAITTASSSWFSGLGGPALNIATISANDNLVATKQWVAGTADNLVARVNSNTRTTDTTVFFYQNGSISSVGITIPAATSGNFRPAGSSALAFAANDTGSIGLTTGTGAGSLAMANISSTWTPASGTTKFLAGTSPAGSSSASTSITLWLALAGVPAVSGTEANDQSIAVVPGTLHHIGCYVSANTRAGAFTGRSRVNTANGNQTFTIPAGTTGYFCDASNSDTLAANDLFLLQLSANSAGSITFNSASAYFDSSVDTESWIQAFTRGGPAITAGTKFSNLADGGIPFSGSNGSVRSTLAVGATLTLFGANIRQNNSTSDTLFNLQVNAVNGNQNFTVPASATGIFRDTTNNDVVSNTDSLLVQVSGHNASISPLSIFAKTVTAATSNVYNVSISESGSAADTQSNVATLPSARTESLTAADTQSTTATLPSAVNDNPSAADTVSNVAIFPLAVTEAGTASETVSNVATLPSAIGETAPISDQEQTNGPQAVTIQESASAVDQVSAQLVGGASVTESAPASSAQSVALTLNLSVTEAASLGDTVAAQLAAFLAMSEAAAAQDQTAAQLVAQIAIQEAMDAEDAVSQTGAVLVASKCNILTGAPRTRTLAGSARVRTLHGGCC